MLEQSRPASARWPRIFQKPSIKLSQAAALGSGMKWKQVEAGMAPIPEHGGDAPMQREIVHDQIGLQIGLAWRGEGLQTVEEVQPGGGIATGSRLYQDRTRSVSQRPEGPAVAVTGVAGA